MHRSTTTEEGAYNKPDFVTSVFLGAALSSFLSFFLFSILSTTVTDLIIRSKKNYKYSHIIYFSLTKIKCVICSILIV